MSEAVSMISYDFLTKNTLMLNPVNAILTHLDSKMERKNNKKRKSLFGANQGRHLIFTFKRFKGLLFTWIVSTAHRRT